MEPVSARYNWTIDDLLTGRRITARLNWRLHYFRATACVFAALMMWSNHRKGSVFVASLFACAFLICLGLFLRRIFSERMLRHQFPKRPDAGVAVGWDISEDGILVTTPHSRTELKWTVFQRVVATPKGILLMPNRQIFHFLPSRSFTTPEEMESVATMASHLVTDFRRMK